MKTSFCAFGGGSKRGRSRGLACDTNLKAHVDMSSKSFSVLRGEGGGRWERANHAWRKKGGEGGQRRKSKRRGGRGKGTRKVLVWYCGKKARSTFKRKSFAGRGSTMGCKSRIAGLKGRSRREK